MTTTTTQDTKIMTTTQDTKIIHEATGYYVRCNGQRCELYDPNGVHTGYVIPGCLSDFDTRIRLEQTIDSLIGR